MTYNTLSLRSSFETHLDNLFDSVLTGRVNQFTADETENEVVITLPLVGYKQNEVEITLKDELLNIVADNKKFGKLTKSFQIWSDIETEKTKAVLEDGLLTITLTKHEKQKPVKIAVK